MSEYHELFVTSLQNHDSCLLFAGDMQYAMVMSTFLHFNLHVTQNYFLHSYLNECQDFVKF